MTQLAARQADDASLVARCLEGDEEAWTALVRRHGPVVFTIARRAGLASDDAADVYQTVWRIAVESLPRLRDPDRFGAWLARTAHFQSMRALRSLCITRRSIERLEPPECGGRSPDEEIVAVEHRRLVADAMALVGARCSDLLRALYFDQPSPAYADIAQRFGMRIGSIGPTRARCLTKLKNLLGRNAHAD